jgi:hypothetical protein
MQAHGPASPWDVIQEVQSSVVCACMVLLGVRKLNQKASQSAVKVFAHGVPVNTIHQCYKHATELVWLCYPALHTAELQPQLIRRISAIRKTPLPRFGVHCMHFSAFITPKEAIIVQYQES